LYYWNKKQDKDYLKRLYHSIEAFDTYLWKYRDSDGDGCLESWCVWDTGEDNSNRFAGTKLNGGGHSGEVPPDDPVFPVESMDYMSYSYDARAALAAISALLGNGNEKLWRDKAKAVQDKIRSYLWDDKRGACYDRDRDNQFMPALQHNNLRAMYAGCFTRKMADRFVKEHLMNSEEFCTPMPLPSIAVNNPVFRNVVENDWSGQPECLTYQRAIRALENYGYFSELTFFGTKLIDCIGKGYNNQIIFPQQFDPFTGAISEPGSRTTYGPCALSILEYISRFYGVHVQFDEIYWGALGRGDHKINYTQNWDGDTFTVETNKDNAVGFINGKEIFHIPHGLRAVTDWQGGVKRIINCSGKPVQGDCLIGGKRTTVTLKPNEVISLV
jgi:hypothetical protein